MSQDDENKTDQKDQAAPDEKKEVAPEEQPDAEELNATMMAIDVSKINLDPTKTDIKIATPKSPTDEDIIREQLEEKKSPLVRLFQMAFRRQKKTALPFRLPRVLEPLLHTWVCDPNLKWAMQTVFYLFRLLVVALALLSQWVLAGQVMLAFQNRHPERFLFGGLFGANLLFSGVALWRKKSPGWLVTYPLSVLCLIMAVGAIFYHTADLDYFILLDGSISDHLSEFYLLSLLYAGLALLIGVVRHSFMRALLVFFLFGALAGVVLNPFQGVRFETGFFGPGFLSRVPFWYLEPLWLSLEVFVPLMLFLVLWYSLKWGKSPEERARHSFACSVLVFLVCLFALSMALMQKNRVLHVFNLLLPQRLDVGGVEFTRLNQSLKIVTKNFIANEGHDSKSRYLFHIRYAKKKKKYLLQVEDAFGFPVKNLKRDDFLITSDDVRIKSFDLVEDSKLDTEKGNYWIKLNLPHKSDVVKWTVEKRSYLPSEFIVLELSAPKKTGGLLVKSRDEILLDLNSPLPTSIRFPLQYFGDGTHRLEVLALDTLGQEIFKKNLDVRVAHPNELKVLFPVAGDTLGGEAVMVTRWSGKAPQTVKSVSYFFRDQKILDVDALGTFQTLDLSAFPDGRGLLKIEVTTDHDVITKTVDVIKAASRPTFHLDEPAMGVFAERDLKVSYSLAGGKAKLAGIRVLVNGTPFDDFTVKDQRFLLPLSRWRVSEIYLSVTASFSDGKKVSDWVQVNRGMSELELSFKMETLGFLNVNKAAVVLDASVSSWDSWQNRSKWQAMNQVILAPEIEAKLAPLSPSFFVFGSKKPYYYHDCSDATDILEKHHYNKALIKRMLEKIQPGGVAAMVSALELAFEVKPDTIFLFSDSSDYCEPLLTKALKTAFKKSPETRIFVISLGKVAAKDQKELMRLAKITGGRFLQPADDLALTTMLIEELVLNYELNSQDKRIAKLPLEDKIFQMGPGSYTLKIPFGNKVQEVPVKLEHGTRTTFMISGKSEGGSDKIHIQQSLTPL